MRRPTRALGLSDDEARRRARLRFGSPVVQRERTFDIDLARGVDAFCRNVRSGVRSLLRTPGFTLTVVLTRALAIGGNKKFGIRLALGATALSLQRMVVGHVVRLGGTGVALGLPLAVAAAYVMRELLF